MGSRSFADSALLTFYTEQPLHCGAESGTGYIDQPVQREKHTGFPLIPGSTIKGILRDEMVGLGKDAIHRFFGSEDAKSPGHVSFGDGFIVAFPVRSSGVPFRWVTCPLVLDRLDRALGNQHVDVAVTGHNAWAAQAGTILLEEIQVSATTPPTFSGVAQSIAALLRQDDEFAYTRAIMLERLVVISDDDFTFLVETGTEVVRRIKIDEESGTTSGEHGNMFNQELVPRDALFAAALREPAPAFPLDKLQERKVLRLGGDETIGRGVVWLNAIRRTGQEE